VRALVEFFLERAERRLTLSDDALRAMMRYRWPGNVRELMNVVEQLLWLSTNGVVGVEQLPAAMRIGPAMVAPIDDRRRQVADDLYDALAKQGSSFWDHVYPMFLARDITRHDIRELVRRGLRETRGRYKGLLELFGMPASDYRRFMNFLAAHDCGVGFREFRATSPSSDKAATPESAGRVLPSGPYKEAESSEEDPAYSYAVA
jgi:DNA-binding NtrC family response regulator